MLSLLRTNLPALGVMILLALGSYVWLLNLQLDAERATVQSLRSDLDAANATIDLLNQRSETDRQVRSLPSTTVRKELLEWANS